MRAMQSVSRDTIYAFATPSGKSGVAVLRISGAAIFEIAAALGFALPNPRVAKLVRLHDPQTGTMIDQALVLYFKAPHSFTGEDLLELHTHGSHAVKHALLDALSCMDAVRMATHGEFSRRAFANGKMDLTEIEGIADMIEAQTPRQLAQATRQMRGEHKVFFETMRAATLEALALLEAYIDFPDEEIPDSVVDAVRTRVAHLRAQIANILKHAAVGERIRDGIEIVLSGAPNAGKSSLLNALAGRDIAIVHESPGTTRDMVEVALVIAGYSVTLVDTAGLREAAHAVEAEGIHRAAVRVNQADLVLKLCDVTNPELYSICNDKNAIMVATKCDLDPQAALPEGVIGISVKAGLNMDTLIRAIAARVEALTAMIESPMITRARHAQHLQKALSALMRFDLALPLELACEELRHAAQAIGNITGKIVVDDVLDVIFKQFCIGK